MVKKIESRVEIRVLVQGRKNSKLNMNKSRSRELVSSLSLSLYLLTIICSCFLLSFLSEREKKEEVTKTRKEFRYKVRNW